jgi:hypothetical protein
MRRTIVQVSRTLQTIVVQRLVPANRTMRRTIVQVSRTLQTIVVQRLVRASRTMRRTIVPASLTTTGTFLVREAPAILTPLDVRVIMLLGPVLLITGLPLQKRAMLLGTTVVLGSRSRVRQLAIVLTRCRSSNPGNTRARAPRTIARKSHRHGLRTIDHNHGPKIIVRLKLRRQGPSSRRVPRILGRNRRRDRRIALKLRRLRIGRCATTRLRKRVQHSRLRNVTLVLRHRRNVRAVLLLHPNVSHGPRRLRNSEKIARRRNRNARTIRRRLLRTKTKSPQRAIENWM